MVVCVTGAGQRLLDQGSGGGVGSAQALILRPPLSPPHQAEAGAQHPGQTAAGHQRATLPGRLLCREEGGLVCSQGNVHLILFSNCMDPTQPLMNHLTLKLPLYTTLKG